QFPQGRGQRQSLGGKKRRVHGANSLRELRRNGHNWKTAEELGAKSDGSDPAEGGAVAFKEEERRGVQREQFQQLAQDAVNGIVQVQGSNQRFRKGVQDDQFAVAPADFLFGATPLRNIKDKSLIGGHVAFGVAHGRGGFAQGSDFSILAADFKFKV